MSVSESTALRYVQLEREHLDEAMEIELDAYPEPWTLGMFLDEIRSDRAHFYVAYLGDVMVGYGGFWLVLDEAHITSVTIRDTFRGRHYGRELTVFLLGLAKSVGARLATLEVRTSNLPARNLYLSLGFRPIGLRKGYYPKSGEDAIVMLKEFE